MTNEIKEILDWFYDEYPKEEKILEKYITNLEEENEKLKSKIDEVINKQLNIEEKFDYKQRVEKAIKYCEESSKTIKSEYFSDVLKILKEEGK